MLIYILPFYLDGVGDVCKIKDEKGERIVYIKLVNMLKNIYRERMLDFKEVRRKCRKVLNQKNVIPLMLNEGELLIPVKIRKARTARDEVYGYINFYFIDKIEDGCIILKDGQKILYIESYRSVIKRTKLVKTLEKEFCDKIKLEKFDFNAPATKGDIAFILNEILYLKKLLE
ncbi:MAG: hypothetical protein N2486_08420 [Caloramator sp.]|nr:hypothetical protein [Caloramator sp.]